MGNHDHHLHDGESLRDAAARRMTERGEQWTDMRAAVFEALAGFEQVRPVIEVRGTCGDCS